MKVLTRNDGGFTIIEILVSAAVFMVGFSVLVALLNGSLLRFSSQELIDARALAESELLRTIDLKDTVSVDSLTYLSNRRYRIEREVHLESEIYVVTINILRFNTGKKIIGVCDAFSVD